MSLALLAGWSLTLYGQAYPANYIPPVKHPVRLSGTFGELRGGHFHMGIDIKSSNGVAGDAVQAVQDGYISRIRVQAGGYGNSIYIDHPDGWTSVYAHLDDFNAEIRAYIEKLQYEEERFELDIAPEETLFTVKKGDLIGKMGNTGWSFGPHLHFELRRTQTEVAHNPLHLGYSIQDTRSPIMKRVLTYQIDARLRNRGSKNYALKKVGNRYTTNSDTLKLSGELSGIGLVTYDLMDMIHHRNGVYRVDAWLDDTPLYSFAFDSIDFNNFRRIEAHMDYRWMATSGEKAHRCYHSPADETPIYPLPANDGLIKLYKNAKARLRLEVSDFSGNKSEASFWVKKGESAAEDRTYQRIVPWDQDYTAETPYFTLYFPQRSVHEELFLYLEQGRKNGMGIVDTFYIGSYEDQPIGDYEARFPLPKTDSLRIAPWTLLWISQNGSVRSLGGEIRGDSLVVQLDRFGQFILTQDTIPPKIKPIRLAPAMNRNQRIQFEIRDNLEASGKARELRYRARMNGEWVLFDYDLKNRKLSFHFPDHMPAGDYDLELNVWDDRDNETQFNYRVKLRN